MRVVELVCEVMKDLGMDAALPDEEDVEDRDPYRPLNSSFFAFTAMELLDKARGSLWALNAPRVGSHIWPSLATTAVSQREYQLDGHSKYLLGAIFSPGSSRSFPLESIAIGFGT